jgi:hypothetical protein
VPSSMIFLGLVVVWLLILVPAVARHRQEVARPSTAALSGRVLDRPRRSRRGAAGAREQEVDVTEQDEEPRSVAVVDGERAPAEPDEHPGWERPAPRYRPGRGGFNPEAAALAARARYAFRQRVVLTMLILVVVTALAGAFLASWVWWVHVLCDLALVGYLAYLRRQVRMEEAIRDRRAARMAGTRRTSAADDPDLDEWAHRGRVASGSVRRTESEEDGPESVDESQEPEEEPETVAEADDDPDDDLAREVPERVAGTGAPLWRGPGPGLDMMEVEAALPRMQPVPPPPLPAGTALVVTDADDPDLHELDEAPQRPEYRRAAGE